MNTVFSRFASSQAATRIVAAVASICTTAALLVCVVSLSDPAVNDPYAMQAKAKAAAQAVTLASAQVTPNRAVR